MTFDPTRDMAEAIARHTKGFDHAMGFRYVRADGDQVVIEYDVGEHHRQPYGIVHGGVHCGVIEAACSTGAALAARDRGQAVVGVENHTSFIHAVRTGTVRVTAVPLTRGRRTQVWEATARGADGRIIATGRVRLLCLDPGTELAGETVQQRPS